jgi:hypothetical protein
MANYQVVDLNVGGNLFTSSTATLLGPAAEGSLLVPIVCEYLWWREGQLQEDGSWMDMACKASSAEQHTGLG